MRSTRQVVLLLAVICVWLVGGLGAARAETDVMFFIGQKHMDLEVVDSYLPNQLKDLFPLLNGELDGAEEANAFGIGVSYARPTWPVAIAVDVLAASGDARGSSSYSYGIGNENYAYINGSTSGSTDIETLEADIGVRKFWEVAKSAYLYLGAGGAWVQADFKHEVEASVTLTDQNMMPIGGLSGEIVRVDDDDDGFGYWMNGGVIWRMKRVSVALDVRWSKADVEVNNPIFDVTNKFNGGGFHFGAMVGYQFGRNR